jgi:hypothetical protein
MITRAYQNADGKRQEVTLPQEQWEVLTEDALNAMLGFGKPAPSSTPAPAPAPKPARRRK